MRKTLVIAAREYNAAVRTKSFVVSLVVLPVMMGGSLVLQYLLQGHVDIEEKRFAVVDRTPGQRLFTKLEEAVRERNQKDIFDPATGKQTKPAFALERVEPSSDTREARDRQRFDLSEQVRHRELFGFLEIGADVLQNTDVKVRTLPLDPDARELRFATLNPQVPESHLLRYQSNSPTYDAFQRWAEHVLNEAVQQQRSQQAGLPADKLAQVLQPVPLVSKGLTKMVNGQIVEGQDEHPLASLLVPGGLMVLMFMMVMIGATPLMHGVVEEKMQRISEVLLGSVQPFELMLGKLLGMVGVSLTLAAVYLGGAYWAAQRYHFTDAVSPEVLAWFVLFQTLAVLMYGSLFIAVGSACSDVRETQTMIWPVMLLAMIPLFVWVNVVREPNTAFASSISLFPFATPMLMIARQAVPPGIPWWLPLLGVGLVLLTTLVCVYAAGRIFRVGILMQGKGAKVGDLFRWVVRG
jgi:ABC-2 type transport system permease protein